MDEISHLQSFMKNEDLDNDTLHNFIRKYQETNCPNTYESIVNGSVNYMIKMCRSYKRQYSYYTQQELLSCMYKGMEKAIEKFDNSKGACFHTYATYWFRYYINEHVLKSSSRVNISQATLSKMKHLSGLMEINSNMSNEQLSEAMDTSVKTIVRLKSIKECMNNYSISSDEYINNQMELTLFEEAQVDYDPELLMNCIEELDPREGEIIIERFGLDDGRPKTLGEIGHIVDLSAERVRQIINNIYPKLKNLYKTKLNI